MRSALMTFALFFLLASPAWPQAEPPSSSAGPTPDKGRYANMPPEAVPFRRFSKPYHEWFVDKETLAYYGAAKPICDAAQAITPRTLRRIIRSIQTRQVRYEEPVRAA